MSKFSEKIISLRKDKCLSQIEVAKALCRKQNTVSAWEKGVNVPPISEVVKIAELYDIPAEVLTNLIIKDIYVANRRSSRA